MKSGAGPANGVDLLLGGPQGLWALSRVEPGDVRRVCAGDEAVTAEARGRGFSVWAGDPHDSDFSPAEACLSVHFPRILRPGLLGRYARAYNLHPGLLPWGRGYYPVFWALWEDTPAGATLHAMTERVDEGPLVAQEPVACTGTDTGGSLHARVLAAERGLFEAWWPRIRDGESLPTRPQEGPGSTHTRAQFEQLREPASWQALSPESLARLVRCLTFPGFPNLQFERGGQALEWALGPDGALVSRDASM